MIGVSQGAKQGTAAQGGAAGAQHHDAVGVLTQAVGQRQQPAQLAVVALAAVVVERCLRQVDEARFERCQLGRHHAHLAFRGHARAALQQARYQVLQPIGVQKMLGPHLGRRRPVLVSRHEQWFVVIRDRFVGQFHGHSSASPGAGTGSGRLGAPLSRRPEGSRPRYAGLVLCGGVIFRSSYYTSQFGPGKLLA